MDLQQRPLLLNLTKSTQFLPDGAQLPVFSVQHRHDDAGKIRVVSNGTATSDCHYAGSVHARSEEGPVIGWVAVSLCNGMVSACMHGNAVTGHACFYIYKLAVLSVFLNHR